MRNRLPEWLRNISPLQQETNRVREIIGELELQTVCRNAQCPNRGECYATGTVTFLIMGRFCTRNCRFCAVASGEPEALDSEEPLRIAEAVRRLGLNHVVITSVTRDDIHDGGAAHFAEVIRQIKHGDSEVTIEVLTPDFQGSESSLKTILAETPDLFNHNLETVPRLYPEVRAEADYGRSLALLKSVKRLNPTVYTKSGIMVGLGENFSELLEVMDDLRTVKCDILTIGQYLQPTRQHYPVQKYLEPGLFLELEKKAYAKGFSYVASGPLVRSSFHAADLTNKIFMGRKGV